MVTTPANGEGRRSGDREEESSRLNCAEVTQIVTPELVQALDQLCALAREMGRQDMAGQCENWARQLRTVLDMDPESQKKVLSEIWLG